MSNEEREIDCECFIPSMKTKCDLEVNIGNKNKIIYVCPGKLQYFTINAICCCNDERLIELEYCGKNIKCICGETVICGCLGYYKVVESGIIFIPHRKLSELHNNWFPTDILGFSVKVKDDCDNNDKCFKYDVVFTYSQCAECDNSRGCRTNKCCK